MKKIQVTTAAIKAEAQVIVLNASLVSRIVKSHSELKNVVRNLKDEAQRAVDSNRAHKEAGATAFYDTILLCSDVNSVDRVFKLLSDIVFAFDEDEDGTAPANDYNSFEGMKVPNTPEPQDC